MKLLDALLILSAGDDIKGIENQTYHYTYDDIITFYKQDETTIDKVYISIPFLPSTSIVSYFSDSELKNEVKIEDLDFSKNRTAIDVTDLDVDFSKGGYYISNGERYEFSASDIKIGDDNRKYLISTNNYYISELNILMSETENPEYHTINKKPYHYYNISLLDVNDYINGGYYIDSEENQVSFDIEQMSIFNGLTYLMLEDGLAQEIYFYDQNHIGKKFEQNIETDLLVFDANDMNINDLKYGCYIDNGIIKKEITNFTNVNDNQYLVFSYISGVDKIYILDEEIIKEYKNIQLGYSENRTFINITDENKDQFINGGIVYAGYYLDSDIGQWVVEEIKYIPIIYSENENTRPQESDICLRKVYLYKYNGFDIDAYNTNTNITYSVEEVSGFANQVYKITPSTPFFRKVKLLDGENIHSPSTALIMAKEIYSQDIFLTKSIYDQENSNWLIPNNSCNTCQQRTILPDWIFDPTIPPSVLPDDTIRPYMILKEEKYCEGMYKCSDADVLQIRYFVTQDYTLINNNNIQCINIPIDNTDCCLKRNVVLSGDYVDFVSSKITSTGLYFLTAESANSYLSSNFNSDFTPNCPTLSETCPKIFAIYSEQKVCTGVQNSSSPTYRTKFGIMDITDDYYSFRYPISGLYFDRRNEIIIRPACGDCYNISAPEPVMKQEIEVITGMTEEEAMIYFDDNYNPKEYTNCPTTSYSCCSDTDYYIGRTLISGNNSLDLSRYQEEGFAGGCARGSTWVLYESGYNLEYGRGTVDENGTMIGFPDHFTSNYSYYGYMHVKIICSDNVPEQNNENLNYPNKRVGV